ncbi:hypothetical protein KUTeg_013075 [Tegillarca granosa]|uniref:Inositol-tetrakisphosphate 1-kinase N-terminal domain-containing protein n=1 Tax=Tegillarca granosa TaxID=220873 RepID=A0ABQ9EW54_TEGGR|nr:hypothetical protein KUTeg_013075 [Tegillarca granosa]
MSCYFDKFTREKTGKFADLQKTSTPGRIDIDKPLDGQGPFDLIVHKFAGVMAAAQDVMKLGSELIKSYIARHPDCIIVDPLESITKIIDRYVQYNLLLQCNDLWQDACLFTPTFVELTSNNIETNSKKLKEASVTFPIDSARHQKKVKICPKPIDSSAPPVLMTLSDKEYSTLLKVRLLQVRTYLKDRNNLLFIQNNCESIDDQTIIRCLIVGQSLASRIQSRSDTLVKKNQAPKLCLDQP